MNDKATIQYELAQSTPLTKINRNTKNGKPFYTIRPSDLEELCDATFGENEWKYTVRQQTIEHVCSDPDTNGTEFKVVVSVVVRLVLSSGPYHEDVGYGHATHADKQSAIDQAAERAQRDGFGRCARQFGNRLGNCLSQKFVDQVERAFNPA